MTEIRFYHLTRRTLEQTLPTLLEKSLERGWRALVLTASEERADALSQHLWTYRPDGFLPHGTRKDGHADRQPVLIAAEDDRANQPQVLFLTEGSRSDHLAAYDLVCDLFDGNDPEAVAAARQRWKAMKEAGHGLTYWQQTENGSWEKKA